MRMLVTGFRPFGEVDINPTERLMRVLADEDMAGVALEALVLDTDYRRCEEQFRAALERVHPRAVLSFGLSMAADELRLERIAVNLDDARIPDTSGLLRRGERIVEDGPVGYWSTLPLGELYAALQEEDIAVGMSNHAGTYLCNHLFYYGRHLIETRRLGTRMGFLHVPPLPEQVAGLPGRKGMDLETLQRAAETCVRVVARSLG